MCVFARRRWDHGINQTVKHMNATTKTKRNVAPRKRANNADVIRIAANGPDRDLYDGSRRHVAYTVVSSKRAGIKRGALLDALAKKFGGGSDGRHYARESVNTMIRRGWFTATAAKK